MVSHSFLLLLLLLLLLLHQETSIEQLPEALLLLVLSFIPTLAEKARTSILSRRWRNLWHNSTCLDFDATNLLPRKQLSTSHNWYVEWVNKVIHARDAIPQSPFVKMLRIQYGLSIRHKQHIDRWIDFSIANRVEILHLELEPYWVTEGGLIHPCNQYKLSEESWYRAPSGLSSLKCLKSLVLFCVNVSERFIHFILSSCPLLEDLLLDYSGTFSGLDISGVPPLRLKRLHIDIENDFVLAKLCAPYLTSLTYRSKVFNPQKIDVPKLNDLTIGSTRTFLIKNYLEHLWTYLPQLEKLELIMLEHQSFSFTRLPELVGLKYLKICVDWDTDLAFYPIMKFIYACPLLETFALEIYDADEIPSRLFTNGRLRKEEWWRSDGENNCSFKCLKVLELYGGDGKTLDQEVVKCIIRDAPKLAKVIVDLGYKSTFRAVFASEPKIVQGVKAKAKELCQKRPLEIVIAVAREKRGPRVVVVPRESSRY